MTPTASRVSMVIVLVALTMCSIAAAQEWTGELGLGYVWQDVSGSQESFRSQTNLHSGFVLESLTVDHRGENGSELSVDAWGFGDAQPAEQARVVWRPSQDWDLRLSYDRRESFFALAASELGWRSDQWEIARWHTSVAWHGWSAATLSLDLRQVERSGDVTRPFFGLNELYETRIRLDESMHEGTLRLETRDLPVFLLVEQSFAEYSRSNRYGPGQPEVLLGEDPDLLEDVGTTINEDTEVPTTRLVVTYGGGDLEVAGSLLWSPAELETSGAGWQRFAIGGGDTGSVEWVDTVMGSANMDTLAGNMRLAVGLGDMWRLRLDGRYRELSTDSRLLGERLLRMLSPDGAAVEIGAPMDTDGVFNTTDTYGRGEIELHTGPWAFWVGGFVADREVDWRRHSDDIGERHDRSSDGVVLGASVASRRLDGSVEYERGGFQQYVFRTDPETVDRVTLRLRSRLDGGWSLGAHARLESADNPVAPLDHSSTALGVNGSWSAADGTSSFGLDLDRIDLSTDTGLELPDVSSGQSSYSLDVLTISAWGHHEVGPVRLRGTAVWVDDSGSTWPVEAWNVGLRIGVMCSLGFETSVFARYWSYDEARSDLDDYNVTRYGLAVTWRFE